MLIFATCDVKLLFKSLQIVTLCKHVTDLIRSLKIHIYQISTKLNINLYLNFVIVGDKTDLEEDNDDEDSVADGEDAPEHPDRLAVPHELVGVVVRRLAVLQLRLHADTKPLLL